MIDRIVTCPEWGARPPARPPTFAGRPNKILFHHTAGHHREIDTPADESRAEAFRYARDIQAFHMSPSTADPSKPWNDTGQSFLVCRNGVICEGRHGTVDAILKGRMVVSAHCPGENDQPGIEHEHAGSEPMTDPQRRASRWLHLWIAQHCGIRPAEVYGHDHFFPTDCPGSLLPEVRQMRLWLATTLTANPYSHISSEMFRWFLWKDRGSIPEERPLARVRARIPASWWVRYRIHHPAV